jgi:hypothetical protein
MVHSRCLVISCWRELDHISGAPRLSQAFVYVAHVIMFSHIRLYIEVFAPTGWFVGKVLSVSVLEDLLD